MSFYDDASLVVIPSGFKTSKVYAEKPTDGSGDLTFTRTGDTATRVGPDGLIQEVRTNLFLQSEAFNNAAWANASTIATANATTAPNGTLTADKLALAVGANPLATNSTGTTQNLAVTSGVYTYSIYLKAGERNIARWRDGGFSGNYLVVDLTNGTFTNGEPTRFQNVQVISAGNGWYRVVFTTGTVTNANAYPLRFGDTGQTGDGVSGGFAWGAQFEATDFGATPYISTTTAAVSVGPVANLPRLDYLNSSCPRLLLEPQRTNLVTYSEQLNNAAWVKSAGGTGTAPAVTANNATSPDGYQNADTVVFNAGAGATTSDQSTIYQAITTGAGSHTASFYAKTASGTAQLLIRLNSATYEKITITNQWQRFTLTQTLTAGTNYLEVVIRRGISEPLNASATVQLWGAQVEAGSYGTSYIPTLSASATRSVDFYEKAGFGNVSTAGTLYYEFQNYQSPAAANGLYMVCLFAGSAVTSTAYSPAESISIINNGVTVQGRNDGLATTLFSITPALNATVKVALRYDGTNVVAFVNGVKGTVFSDTAVGAKNAIRVNNGENATHATKQLLFFPSALTDAQLIELTTL